LQKHVERGKYKPANVEEVRPCSVDKLQGCKTGPGLISAKDRRSLSESGQPDKQRDAGNGGHGGGTLRVQAHSGFAA
jgi:hypothetical protein